MKWIKENLLGVIFWGGLVVLGVYEYTKDDEPYQKGNMDTSGGSPTYRYEYTPSHEDNTYTTNDESNDQELGYYGTQTVSACNGNSGNCYDLDADISGDEVERLYFEKGGWVDIDYSDCDGGYCYLEDENGTEWEIEY